MGKGDLVECDKVVAASFCAVLSSGFVVRLYTTVISGVLGYTWYTVSVTSPHVPPPPPRMAQKRSAFSFAFALRIVPSGVTTCAGKGEHACRRRCSSSAHRELEEVIDSEAVCRLQGPCGGAFSVLPVQPP